MSTIIIRPEDIPPDEPSPATTGRPIVITYADIEGQPEWKRFLSQLWSRINSWLGQTKTAERPTSTTAQSAPMVLSIPSEPAPVMPRPDESVAKCPFCQNPLDEHEARTCNICKTPHHKECWEANGGCTTLGCRNTPVTVRR